MPFIYLLVALIAVAIIARITNTNKSVPENWRGVMNVVLGLIVVGMVLWLINTYIPMAGSIKAILNIVVVVATCVRVLQAVGLWSGAVKLWNDFKSHRTAH